MITITETSVTLDYSHLPEADRKTAVRMFKNLSRLDPPAIKRMYDQAARMAMIAEENVVISGACSVAAMVLAAAVQKEEA